MTPRRLPLAEHTETELAKLAEFDAAPEPEELVVERVARALCDGDAEDHGGYTWKEAATRSLGGLRDSYRQAARHAIAAMEDAR